MHDSVLIQKQELENTQDEHGVDIQIAKKIIVNISRSINLDLEKIKYCMSLMEVLDGDLILCAKTPSNGEVLLIADFTGHGLGAVIKAMIVTDIFCTMVSKGLHLEEVIYELNHKLLTNLPTG